MSETAEFKVYYMHATRPNLKFTVPHEGVRTQIVLKDGSALITDEALDDSIQTTLRKAPIAGLLRIDYNEASAKHAAAMAAGGARQQAVSGAFTSQSASAGHEVTRNAELESLLNTPNGKDELDKVTDGNLVGTVPGVANTKTVFNLMNNKK